MTFAWEIGILYFVLSLVLILAIYGALGFVLVKVAKRKVSFVFLGVSCVVFLVSFIFNLTLVAILTGFITAAC